MVEMWERACRDEAKGPIKPISTEYAQASAGNVTDTGLPMLNPNPWHGVLSAVNVTPEHSTVVSMSPISRTKVTLPSKRFPAVAWVRYVAGLPANQHLHSSPTTMLLQIGTPSIATGQTDFAIAQRRGRCCRSR